MPDQMDSIGLGGGGDATFVLPHETSDITTVMKMRKSVKRRII